MNNDWREYTGDSDYLAHHGVKGMKWGVRKAGNAIVSKGKQMKASHDRAFESTKKYRENTSLGKRVVQNLLLGTARTTTYQMARSYGEGRVKSLARSVFDVNVNDIIGKQVQKKVKDSKYGDKLGGYSGALARGAAEYAMRDSGLSLQQQLMMNKYKRKGKK